MDLPAAMLVHLQDLLASIGRDDHDLSETLAALTTALCSTADSYCGLQLTLVESQWPVTLTAFADPPDLPIRTSLRLPLALVSRRLDSESWAVFFASTPGAFVDLAADLSHALGGVQLELDADAPPLSRESGLTGLAELTVLNRAIGMLVARGHDIEQAHHLLRRDAADAGVERHVYAARILRR